MFKDKHPVLTAVVLAGLVAGSVDVGAASLIGMLNPLKTMRAIASGLLGPEAFHGGLPAALLGLLLQWGMAMLIAAIYVFATARLPALRRRWIPAGLLAGVVIYFVMVYLVLPLSAAPFRQEFSLAAFIKDFAFDADFVKNMLAMMVFGLIVAFFAKDLAPVPKT